jgi:hypothetical protein
VHQPDGWQAPPRARIVVLLRDHLAYHQQLGLSEPADNRTMALASILAGNWPGAKPASAGRAPTVGARRKKTNAGMTVADVMKAETAAIRLARSKLRRDPKIRAEYPAFAAALSRN